MTIHFVSGNEAKKKKKENLISFSREEKRENAVKKGKLKERREKVRERWREERKRGNERGGEGRRANLEIIHI